MTTPSSAREWNPGGVEPGVVPPISAWWPRLARKKRIDLSRLSKTGVMTVISGRCVPAGKRVVEGDHIARAECRAAPPQHDVRTLSPIAPRWTGTCGAFATSFPSASKDAQEKSSRSLMLTLSEELWSTVPACSATLMKMLLKNSSSTGSAVCRSHLGGRLSRALLCAPVPGYCPWSVTLTRHPGSTMVVAASSRIRAGPDSSSPRAQVVALVHRRVVRRPPLLKISTRSIGSSGTPAARRRAAWRLLRSGRGGWPRP